MAFSAYHFESVAQFPDLTFTARAPPTISENVSNTGTHVRGKGDVRAVEEISTALRGAN